MKKFDLHVHTISTISDSQFDFSLEKLIKYVEELEIDCIAITNHNLFDLEQFKLIAESLDIYVLPGIEINLENGHLILISENTELEDFEIKCNFISSKITKDGDVITLREFREIFTDLSRYLLIPHYDKKPEINEKTLQELEEYISAGEVNSPKKFCYCISDVNSLVPVIFSDIRIREELQDFPPKQTYLDLDEISLRRIKLCLSDKNKVFLSKNDGHKLFQVLDGLEISTGLNVIMGERSSGKTFTLKRICEEHENVKHIKQFSLLSTDEEADRRNFEELLSRKKSATTLDHLKEFKDVVDDINKIDLRQNYIDIDRYLTSLKKFASETEKADAFSNALLFNESLFLEANLHSLKKLIDSTNSLLENIEYKDIINAFINETSLVNLYLSLIGKYIEGHELNLKKRWVNDLVTNIKTTLHMRTAATYIEDINFVKIVTDFEKVNKFEAIVESLKKETEILSKDRAIE